MWRDQAAWGMADDEFEHSVVMTQRTLDNAQTTWLLRPGSGFVSRHKIRIAERHGYRCLLGSVYAFDAQIRSVRWIGWFVRTLLKPGAIVILHEGKASRRHVLPVLNAVLSEAQRRGLSAVTAGQLIASRETALSTIARPG